MIFTLLLFKEEVFTPLNRSTLILSGFGTAAGLLAENTELVITFIGVS